MQTSVTHVEVSTHQHNGAHTHHDHGHHHEESWLEKYVFSKDHKIISKQFLITGMFWGVVGGLLSVIFRLQLGWPNETFPFLETLFGRWAEGGKISNEFYYSLVTMHGTILVFFVLTGGLSGTFANLLIPYQLGVRDMASGFINMLSYWFFFAASVVMFASFFVQTGAASGGWTAYPPLNGINDISINKGSGIGFDLWAISMSLFIVSSLLGGLNYVATILNMRTKGMTMMKMPLTIWAFLFTAVLGILSFPALLAGVALLEFDRLLGTSFYLNDIIINGNLLDYKGGSPILYQHLFWFLGHPEVYIIILPAMGIVSEVLSVHSRKPIFGYRAMVISIMAIVVISFLVWAHHMFVTGMNPNLGAVFVLFTLLIAVPSAIKVFNWIGTIWKGSLRLNTPMMFAIGFVSLFITGGLTGIMLGNSAIDIQLHDTYFVVAHFHIVMGVAAFFGMYAGVYHWFPRFFGRFMNETLGLIHFWVTLIGGYAIFFPMHFMTGLPRRYYSFANFETFNNFDSLVVFISVSAIVVFLAQILFIVNFFYSIFRGRKVEGEVCNPWGGTTLEWTAPVERLHGNWPGEIPTVHRWPYDYNVNGRDFIPQTEPLKAGEVEHK
ncbi:MAG: cbb3-type cytochrome c oxidase subunit I [Chitinophagales bacterium]|nr:cbb3-type cytochrome c oxidase subunit I [Chitinophagales bacterium]MDW8272624.1 cbb3-type cytochrome c oxidase subunit I [Chitinophagales bacterium]